MREFTVEDLVDILKENILVIILGVICSLILGYLYSTTVVVPLYEASAKIILVKQESSAKQELANLIGTSEITSNDIILNQKLVSTYSEIIKSRTVLSEVRENLNLKNITIEDLADSITVSPVKDTEVIDISVKSKNANDSAAMANELVSVFSKEILRIYNIQNVQIVDKAIVSKDPINISIVKNMMIFAAVAAMLIYGLYFMKEYLNNKVSRLEDLEALNLNVLASIPSFKENHKGGRI